MIELNQLLYTMLESSKAQIYKLILLLRQSNHAFFNKYTNLLKISKFYMVSISHFFWVFKFPECKTWGCKPSSRQPWCTKNWEANFQCGSIPLLHFRSRSRNRLNCSNILFGCRMSKPMHRGIWTSDGRRDVWNASWSNILQTVQGSWKALKLMPKVEFW